jgi:hypothetical protein
MRELRLKMLITPPRQFGIMSNAEFPRVYGVLMDWPLDQNTVSVVGLCDGNASIYTTSTFGVIGGVGHERVRAAASQLVKVGEKHYDAALRTTDYSLPDASHVRFYLVGFDGVRFVESKINALVAERDNNLDLWRQSQRLLTELQLVSERDSDKK